MARIQSASKIDECVQDHRDRPLLPAVRAHFTEICRGDSSQALRVQRTELSDSNTAPPVADDSGGAESDRYSHRGVVCGPLTPGSQANLHCSSAPMGLDLGFRESTCRYVDALPSLTIGKREWSMFKVVTFFGWPDRSNPQYFTQTCGHQRRDKRCGCVEADWRCACCSPGPGT